MKGKVAIVTGGGRGIGKAYCIALLNKGVKVCLCDINEGTALEFIESLNESLKTEIYFKKCDVTDYDNFKDAFDKTMEKYGRIDIVVNNAGVVGEINWKKTVEVNFIGVINGIKLAFMYMSRESGGNGGFVVNTSSIAGLYPGKLTPVYCATKHAVIGLTRSYGADYHFNKTGIKVNAICPGAVATDLLQDWATTSLDEECGIETLNRQVNVETEEVGKALIKILEDGKNGCLLRVDSDGTRYV